MKISYDVEIPRILHSKPLSPAMEQFIKFLRSDKNVMAVEFDTQHDAMSFDSNVRTRIRRNGYNINVKRRQNTVYVEKIND